MPLTIRPTQGLSPNFDSSTDLTPQTAEPLKVALDQMRPQVKALLPTLQPHIIIFDFPHHWLPAMASQLGIKAIHFSIFSTVSNLYLTVPVRMPDPKKPPTLKDLKKPPKGYPKTSITSVKTFQARDFQYLFKSFNGGLSIFERIMAFIKTCDATIYKSCTEIEGPYLDFLKSQIDKPLLLAGPAVPLPPSSTLYERWEQWLGKFPEKSVIYCCFGSEAYLNDTQIKELTLGLELTNLPFFLVLRFETRSVDAHNKLEASLPEEFRERVRDRGVVHAGWVQQQLILAHKSVGCFLTHAGFSSVIEGIVNNCQLALVPQHGDQFMVSKLLSEDLRIGVEVDRRDEDRYYGKKKGSILDAIKTVMVDTDKEPGKSIRQNPKKWKDFS